MQVRLACAATSILLLGAVPVAATAGSGTTASAYPGGKWSPPPARYGSVQVSNLDVRMDDGVVLKADVLYPTDAKTGKRLPGPFPVLLQQDLYAGGASATASGGAVPADYYVDRGYIFVHLHDRGTGGSQGALDATFGPRIGQDGMEMAYWAADPKNVPGSNGHVGLQGCSALGVIQLSTLAQLGALQRLHGRVYVPGPTANEPGHYVPATHATDPIDAAIPECIAASVYHEQFFDDGVPSSIWALATTQPAIAEALTGYDTYDPSSNFEYVTLAADMFAGGDSNFYRAYWRDRDFVRQAGDIGRTGVPLLSWVGWQEAGFMGAQPLYAALQNVAAGRPATAPMTPGQPISPKYQAIVGDWGHAGGLDQGIELEWYATWLGGDDTGLQSAHSSIHLKELPSAATSRWINESTYPMTDHYTPLYLGGGALSPDKPSSSAADQLVWGAGSGVSYTMKPVSTDTTLLGPAAVRLWATSSNSNMQIFAELQDVAPNGTTTAITHASLFGSERQLDPKRSWSSADGLPVRPYPSLDRDVALIPDQPVRLDIPLQPVTWRLVKGHSLRLVIATRPGAECAPTGLFSAPVGCIANVPTAESLAGGVYRVLHDPKHQSLLNAALVPSSQIPTAKSGTTPTSGGVVLPLDWGTSSG